MGHFKNLNLINFRNFGKYSLDLSSNCNVLYGKNGSGKTNLIEAISLFTKGRGLRKDKISNIIKYNNDKFIIKSEFENDLVTYNLISESILLKNQIRKILSVNNDKTRESVNTFYKLTSFLNFLPETERLFLSSPTTRSNFLDQIIINQLI